MRHRGDEGVQLRRALSSLVVGCFAICGAAVADEEELPDLEFLEYLGSWEESDEEWLLFEDGQDQAAADEESDGEASAKKRELAGVKE